MLPSREFDHLGFGYGKASLFNDLDPRTFSSDCTALIELGSGKRQRVKIALSLAQQLQLLLLDEPMRHLDMGCQSEIIDLIGSLHY
jgi:ABC-type Mn2+/Zn2+ transport system ATPase subunit